MKKIILVVSFAILLFIIYAVYWWSEKDVDMGPKITEDTIEFEQKTLYLRAISWGISGSNNEIILSSEPFASSLREYRSEDLVFHTTDLFYKKDKLNNSLLIYFESSAIHFSKFSELNGIKIIPQELKTSDEIKELDSNYLKYGLNKISVY